jgi:hypothetical protein
MATKTDNTIIAANDTDAHFRAWAQFIHDVFNLTSCWVNTTDSGQINLTTVTKPAGASTSQGYEIWKMNDTLQSTKPVFLKIEYGSGAAANTPGIWMTIGTGSDGSGSITGTLFARTQIAAASNNTSTQNKCFGSAATNRVNFAMFLDVNTLPIWFALERTKTEGTTTGADSGDGLILAFGGSTASHKSQVLPFGATAPTAEDGIQCILSRNNPTAYTGDQGIGLMIPILGVAKQPGYNVAVTMGNDFAAFAQPTFSLYGANHTWQHMGTLINNLRVGITDSLTRLLLLYE